MKVKTETEYAKFAIKLSCDTSGLMLGVLRDKAKHGAPLFLYCKSLGLTFKVDLVKEVIMNEMDELNENGGQKCPECGRQTLALGEFALFDPQGMAVIYVRKWEGVDCEHGYLQIISRHKPAGVR